ncbi:hypothetical protein KKJ09_20225 [Xenorhabdus bovienii]|uniref:hypothetical protein n=1 Tax=Xenorhabdus bovienii TaxID=40576 RepID=UPI0023B30751|nr:hypothetical protein [Xenorhabdus bovienii]MDE9495842.1 hypothetical protein [Xenorhabdus bovienii]MDE9504192.1 hypothetical protein [Xenorhabdus bovienii]MDE9526757.1 hypothetical protein [Xenorhabdus bovienii]
MANAFDFELHADENATKALAEIEARLKGLQPTLNSTREGLKFGGSETLDNVGSVSNKLRDMSQFAKDNVQHIGAIIPPLKNVGELTAKYGGLAKKYGGIIGGVGAIGYGATKLYQGVRDAGKDAIARSTRAKNSGMSVADFTRMSGAMQISTGASMDNADQSVESLYPFLQDALTNRNSSTKAELNKIGVEIAKNKNGNADVYQTMKNLAAEWNNIVPETQNTLSKHLGLDDNALAFLRDGGQKKEGKIKIEELLNKSDKSGLTIQDKDNERIEKVGERINEIEARAAGAFRDFKNDMLLTGFGQWDKAKETAKDKNPIHGFFAGAAAFANPFGFNNGGDQLALLKKAKKDDEFRRTLSFKENTDLLFEYASEDLIKKLNAYYFPNAKPSHVGEKVPDMPIVEEPKIGSENNKKSRGNTRKPRGFRNNNPGNLIDAPNAVGKDYGNGHVYMKFATPHDGITALSRQLMLHGDRGQNTLNQVIPIYAPKAAGNKTKEYIDYTAKQLGISPNEKMDLHNPAMIEKLINAIIKMENLGQQPYSKEQIKNGISASIDDPRWAGLRSDYHLQNQRSQYGSNGKNQQFPSLYSNRKDAESDAEIAKGMAKAFQEAIRDKLQVEITLVNDKTGERQKFQSTKSAGKVTTSMQYP